MRKTLRRTLAALLSAALLSGMCLTASAFTYPSAYWKLHSAWDEAVNSKNVEQTLSVAQQTYDLLTKEAICADICYNLEPKCSKASLCAEMKGDIDGAITWLKRQRTFAQWLHENEHSYIDILLNIDARMEYLEAAASPAIYSRTASGQGTLYGTPAAGTMTGESAVLTYITFQDGYSVEYWLDYNMKASDKLRQAIEGGGTIELAWNFSPESTAGVEKVLSSSADSYIAEGVKTMGGLGCTVLLRIGAEMNNWSDCDSAKYIQAFQKIAREAKRYPNIKTVFSPDNISNRNVTFADFYPGDSYVDWIGVSTYHNSNFRSQNGGTGSYSYDMANFNDAYYGTGIYDSDPLVILRPLVRFAKEHNKPMMISECGFSYRNSANGDQSAFAQDQLNKFYSYVNMIYPQVKAVFYFDNDLAGLENAYHFAGNSTLASTYRSVISKNGAYLAAGQTSADGWQELSQLDRTVNGKLQLATYASFPGSASTTVKYYVDGKLASTSSTAPFYFELDTTTLGGGRHTVHAVATSGQFSRTTVTYNITAPAAPAITTNGGAEVSSWAKDLVNQAEANRLVPETLEGTNLTGNINRAGFASVAVRLYEAMSGETAQMGDNPFSDTVNPDVLKAYHLGIVSGMTPTTFQPGALVTREQASLMLSKVYANLGGEIPQADGTAFADNSSISDWAMDAVAFMSSKGIVNGVGDNKFSPKGNATCEQALIISLAMFQKLK